MYLMIAPWSYCNESVQQNSNGLYDGIVEESYNGSPDLVMEEDGSNNVSFAIEESFE